MKPKTVGFIFFKGQEDLDSDTHIECHNGSKPTQEEFERVFQHIYNSSMHYSSSARYRSAQKALDLYKIKGWDATLAFNNLKSKLGKLWNYTGD